jgi:hypothetical protein
MVGVETGEPSTRAIKFPIQIDLITRGKCLRAAAGNFRSIIKDVALLGGDCKICSHMRRRKRGHVLLPLLVSEGAAHSQDEHVGLPQNMSEYERAKGCDPQLQPRCVRSAREGSAKCTHMCYIIAKE